MMMMMMMMMMINFVCISVSRAGGTAAAFRAGTPAGCRPRGISTPTPHLSRCRGNGCHGDDDLRADDRPLEGQSR